MIDDHHLRADSRAGLDLAGKAGELAWLAVLSMLGLLVLLVLACWAIWLAFTSPSGSAQSMFWLETGSGVVFFVGVLGVLYAFPRRPGLVCLILSSILFASGLGLWFSEDTVQALSIHIFVGVILVGALEIAFLRVAGGEVTDRIEGIRSGLRDNPIWRSYKREAPDEE